MKPSSSKTRVAARVAKHRRVKKERAARDTRAAEDFGKLSTLEQITVHDIVKAQAKWTKAENPARIAAVITKHEAKVAKWAAAKEQREIDAAPEKIRSTHVKDGRIVEEWITPRASEPKPPPMAAPVVIAPTTRQRRGEGDPTIRKVLILRPGSNRREWVSPHEIPTGSEQPLARCKQWEEPAHRSCGGGAFHYALPAGPERWRPDWTDQ